MVWILLASITFYQKTVSPDHGWLKGFFPNGFCQFYPTCSEYGRQALLKHGLWKGLRMTVRRLASCHPWAQGGFDPVN
jgi:uncharacterized protein